MVLRAASPALVADFSILFFILWFQERQPLRNVVVCETTNENAEETDDTNWCSDWVPDLPSDTDTDYPDEDNTDGDECTSSDGRNTCCDIAAAGVVDACQEWLSDHQASVLKAVLCLLEPLVAVLHFRLWYLCAEWIVNVLIDRHQDSM